MNTNIKPGYLLYRSKGFVEHAGVYLGRSQVLHNSPSGDIEVVSFSEYANGQVVKVIETGEYDHSVLAQRLVTLLESDSKYHVSGNNCEHIARMMIHGRRFSPQIQATMAGAIIAGLASWKTGKGNPFLMMLLGGLSGCALSNAAREYDGHVSPNAYLYINS